MMTGGFALKFNRADEHLHDLVGQISLWLDGNHHSVTRERDPHDPHHFIVRASADPVPPETFSLLVGDTIHNFRACLGYLAFALASKHTSPLPDEIAEKSEFPIFGDKDRKGQPGMGASMFRDNGRAKIQAMHPSAQAAVEKMQPYHRGKGFDSHPLWQLHCLSNIDKHRLLLITVFASQGAILSPDGMINVANIANMNVRGGPVERDTKVLEYWARPVDPDREMHVEFRPAFGVAFADGFVEGKDVLQTLSGIRLYILGEVIPPLEPFL